MRISEKQRKSVELHTKRERAKKYLHENKNQRETRKWREYCKKNKIECGVINAIRETALHRYVKNGEKWETENTIFKIHNKHKWEDRDYKHTKSTRKETCVLYENGKIIIVNATIENHHAELYDKYSVDREENRIFMKLPEYKMSFEVEKMRDFDRISQVIEMEGEKITKEDLLRAILQKAVNIYEVK